MAQHKALLLDSPYRPMSDRIRYEKVLNETQLSAVTAPDGPILVIAGAGSGKTRTLVYRVAWLVEKGVQPEEILLLTFTRKAAKEMLDRAARLGDSRCKRVSGGTFHSLAQRVLREQAGRIGFSRSFTIMDRSDMEEAVRALIPELGKERRTVRFPKSATIATILSKAANTESPIEEVMEAEYPQFLPLVPHIEHVLRLYTEYKRNNDLMDYDDLILFLRSLLRDNEDIRLNVAERYKYIMVDEYQDTNTIQADIVRYLGCVHRNVMVVGDDSQSIYSFRGANFRNMFEFPQSFPEAKIIKLEENYRSTQPILTMTNALMDQATQKYTKCLFTRREGNELPLAIDTGTERDQAVYVCRAIESLVDEGRPLRDIAVLFRASYHSFELELELARRTIPFAKYGGFKFMESAHIKDLLAHLRVIINRHDVLSWGRLLRLLRHIGPGKSQAIMEWMRNENVPPAKVAQWPGGTREKEGLAALAKLMKRLSAARITPEEAVEVAVEYYKPVLEEKFDDFPRRQQELEQLSFMASRYKSMRAFLDDLSLEPPASPADVRPLDRSDYLTLSTVHSAKGLEWGVVFVIWLIDGRFPPAKSFRNMASLEEELRLLYVASTRAKDKLNLLYPGRGLVQSVQGWSGSYQGGLSSFIRALPREVIEHRSAQPPYLSSESALFASGVWGETSALPGPESLGLRPGDRINHPAFGTGIIARFLSEDRVEVIFRDKGLKLLHLGYTSLEKI